MSELLNHIDQIHTTPLGKIRIMNNLSIKEDNVVEAIKKMIQRDDCKIYQKGKNYYCEIDSIIITIHSHNYCIITAHKK